MRSLGSALVQYEHFEPEFAEATAHSVDGICLLCPTHHQAKNKLLSREAIRRAMAEPKAKSLGFAAANFDPGVAHPKIAVGTLSAEEVDVILRIDGEDVISILPPEEPGAPFGINAHIRNAKGDTVLQIVENVLQTPTANWDVRLIGRRLRIHNALRNIDVSVRMEPGVGLTFERLIMRRGGHGIVVLEGKPIYVELPSEERLVFSDWRLKDARCMLRLEGNQWFVGTDVRGYLSSGRVQSILPFQKLPADVKMHARRLKQVRH